MADKRRPPRNRRLQILVGIGWLLAALSASTATTSDASFSGGPANTSTTAEAAPLFLTDAAWWLDAASEDTLFSDLGCTTQTVGSGSVACWQDRRASGNSITYSTGPATKAPAAINGLDSVSFDSSVQLTGPDLLGGTVSDMQMFLVSREVVASNNFLVSFDGGNANTNPRFALHAPWASSGKVFWDPGILNPNRSESSGRLVAVGLPMLTNGWKDSGAGSNGFRVNQGTTFDSTGHTTADSSGGISLGENGGGNSLNEHEIAELIVFAERLSSAEETEIEDYLIAKWGIS